MLRFSNALFIKVSGDSLFFPPLFLSRRRHVPEWTLERASQRQLLDAPTQVMGCLCAGFRTTIFPEIGSKVAEGARGWGWCVGVFACFSPPPCPLGRWGSSPLPRDFRLFRYYEVFRSPPCVVGCVEPQNRVLVLRSKYVQ